MSLTQVSARIKDETVARVDRIAVALTATIPGAKDMSRADALRAVIERGVEALERELGLAAGKTAPKGGPRPARKPR